MYDIHKVILRSKMIFKSKSNEYMNPLSFCFLTDDKTCRSFDVVLIPKINGSGAVKT